MSSTTAKEAAANQVISNIGNQIRDAYDADYRKKIEGKVEIVTLIFNAVAFFVSSFMGCPDCRAVNYFSIVCGCAIWLTLTFFILHSFHITDRITVIPWIYLEIGYTGLWTILYFISFIFLIFKISYIFLAVMGFIGAIAYGYQTKAFYPKLKNFLQEANVSSPTNEV